MISAEELTKRIAIARKEMPADLLLKNAHIFHLQNGVFEDADIALCNGTIAGIGTGFTAQRVLDLGGRTVVPGFIDAHMHVESSCVTPALFAATVVRYGITTTVCDPHELANVVGTKAFQWLADCAPHLPIDFIIRLSSCVPSTHMETAGAEITSSDLEQWHQKMPQAALAEFMNVPGVLFKDPEVLKKISLFNFIDGHAPLLEGDDLNAYLSAGVRNDHECSNLAEAQEKLRRGMQVFIREGSVAKNLDALLPLITPEQTPYLCFCTDDRNPLDIQRDGHMDKMIARAIAFGARPLDVYRVASWSAAQHLQLLDRGLIAPGKRADLVILDDLNSCKIHEVIARGKIASELAISPALPPIPEEFLHTVKRKPITVAELTNPAAGTNQTVPVLGVTEGSLLTDNLRLPANSPDIQQVAVLERHGKNGNIALGFVRGFKLTQGAIASSMGHDSHNICVVGCSPEEMTLAVNALIQSQGGFAIAIGKKVEALFPLPVGGLISASQDEKEVLQQMKTVLDAAKKTGCPLESPFLQLAFLPLPVIPHLKITDMGLVDVDQFKLL